MTDQPTTKTWPAWARLMAASSVLTLCSLANVLADGPVDLEVVFMGLAAMCFWMSVAS